MNFDIRYGVLFSQNEIILMNYATISEACKYKHDPKAEFLLFAYVFPWNNRVYSFVKITPK